VSNAAPLQALEDWAGALLQRLTPQQSQRLALQLARDLRNAQGRRMRAQKSPTGEAWEPRKPPQATLRSTGKRVLREGKTGPMMRGLAQAKFLRAQATPTDATVTFADRVQRMARVHHFGETDAVNHPKPPIYDYPARELLGISDSDLQRLRNRIFKHLSP
jgi:phage virion morphogenesis protein